MRMFWLQPFAFTYNDTWAPDRTGARFPRLSGTWGSAATAWNYRASDNLLYNSGYVRLSDIQIGYSMNSKDQPWLNSISVSQLRVYINGRDLWETSSLPKGFNPETGLRASFHPYPRYIGMGLDITF